MAITTRQMKMIKETMDVLGDVETLDEWECDFIVSLHNLPLHRTLSPRQKDKLENIYAKVCVSPH